MSELLTSIEIYRSSPLLYFAIWLIVIATPIVVIAAVAIFGRMIYLDRHPEHAYWQRLMKEHGLRMNPAGGVRPSLLDPGYLFRDGR
jgi:hypothetical protein